MRAGLLFVLRHGLCSVNLFCRDHLAFQLGLANVVVRWHPELVFGAVAVGLRHAVDGPVDFLLAGLVGLVLIGQELVPLNLIVPVDEKAFPLVVPLPSDCSAEDEHT